MIESKPGTEELISMLRNRSNEGFSILYNRYGNCLFGIISKIVKTEEEAENLLQDTFVKIWKNIHQYDADKGAFFTWILNIARNTAIDYLRSKNHAQQAKNQSLENTVSIRINKHVVLNVEHIGIREMVNNLVKTHREAIELVYFGGYTQEDAAEQLKIPVGTLKNRVRIALRELKKMI